MTKSPNKIKHIKYKGSIISGSKGDYWSYAMGQDIYGKTIEEMKDKIYKMEHAGMSRIKYHRNPGAAWHRMKFYEHLNRKGHDSQLLAQANLEALHESRRLGIPNPKSSKKPMLIHKFLVVDSPFNRAWYSSLIGKKFGSPPSYAQLKVINQVKVIKKSNPVSKKSLLSSWFPIVLIAGIGYLWWKNKTRV